MTIQDIRTRRLAMTCVLSLAASMASAAGFDFPSRKPGLWELKLVPETAGAAPQITMQLCLDAASDHDIMAAGLSLSTNSCSVTRSQSAGAIQFDATCDIGGRHTVSHSTITGDFQSSYTLKVVSDSEGGSPVLPRHSVMTQEAKWLGACTPGLVPGDMVMPGGRKINVLSTLKKPGG